MRQENVAGRKNECEEEKLELLRKSAFDFAVRDQPDYAIEIKGLKKARGDILFTDREWTEARSRRENYWLVVVGHLTAKPSPRVIRDPSQVLHAKCRYQSSLSVTWSSTVSVAD